MEIKSREIQHTFRNRHLKYGGTAGNYSLSNSASSSNIISKWFYEDEDGNLHSKLNFIGDNEISAYGAGDSGTGGDVTIIDNLTSTAIDCALSANMGRHLKSLIDSKTGISSWDELTDKPAELTDANMALWIDAASKRHEHSNKSVMDGITAAKITNWDNTAINSHTHTNKVVLDDITSTLVGNWNTAFTNNHTHSNKSVLDGITSTKVSNWDSVYTNWNKAFEFDSDGNLRVKINLIGEQEVSAYGAGSTGGSGAITIVDALTSTSVDAALSANQGRVLKSLIDSKSSISSWNDLTDKPSTFTPSAHSHTIGDVTNLQSLLDNKVNKTGEGATGNWNININGNAVYAPNSTRLYSSDSQYAYGGVSPYYMYMSYNGAANRWKLKVNPATPEDVEVNYATSAGSAESAGSSTTAAYLPTWYLGSVQNNPQTYFSSSIGLRVAMTGAWSVWSDTLWINGYSGGDVPNMCALHFLRNGTPRMAISTQHNAGSSYGGFYEVLTDYNYNSRCPTLTGGGASGYWDINITGISKGLESITTTTGNNMTDRPWQLWYWNQWVGDTAGIPASYMCGLNMRAQDTNYGMQLGTTAFNDVLYFRKYKGGAYRPWQIIATTDGNVYSATKLQTARTIWGQSFDGTGNVDGTFRNIAGEGNVISHKILTYPTAPYGLITRIENNGTVTLQSQRESNDSECYPLILNPNGGNVGIGTTSPNYKLEVGGDIKSYGWLRTIGTQGWYNDTYGGGWYMEDDTYLRSYGNKAILTDNNTYYSYNTSGGYHSNAAYGVGGTSWTDVSSYLNHVFIVANKATPIQCYNRILGWADVINGAGYQTRYGISSLRNGHNWGAMAFSITNNDAGTSGHQLLLYANGTMNWTGNIVAAGEITAYSDARLKSDIKLLENRGYISPVTYTKDGKQSIGFVAQDVQKLYPELVTEGVDENKYLSMNYAQYVAVLQAQIIDLNKRLMQLETKRI